MKNVLLALIFICLSVNSFSQNQVAYLHSGIMDNSDKRISIKNRDFLNVFNDIELPKKVQKMLGLVANYDIKSSPLYNDKESFTYNVIFKEGKNRFIATYNQHGEILNCKVKANSVRLPLVLGQQLSRTHPDWGFNKIKVEINYSLGVTRNMTYKIHLLKGNKSKRVKIAS